MLPRLTLSIMLALLGGTGAAAAPQPLDLVPDDAAVALVVRSPAELKKKGDKLIADTGVKYLMRPSQLFDWVYQNLEIKGGVDEAGSAALVVANPKLLGVEFCDANGNPNFAALNRIIDLVVVVVPFQDRDKMAANFGIARGALKPDTMVKGRAKHFGRFFYARGRHVFYGNDEKVVAAVAKAPPAGAGLTAARRRTLNEADVVFRLSPQTFLPFWKKELLGPLENDLVKQGGEAERKVARQFIATLGELQAVWVAARVDDGIRLTAMGTFPGGEKGPARAFLTALQGGPGVSDLKGLPAGRVVAAQAFRGDGARNAALATLLVGALHDKVLQLRLLLSAADRPNFVGVFTEVWQRLTGGRVAVYQNADPAKQGLFSVVAILDTEDAGRFVAALKSLARLADAERRPAEKDLRAEIDRLVRDLGDRRYRVRQSATTRLGLVGEPALAALEKALAAPDAEVARRAAGLKKAIVAAAVERRKELAEGRFRRLHPALSFAPRPEMRDGQPVEVVQVKLAGQDARAADQLRHLFGPDWDRIRLAVHGKQVVALLGSDQALLGAALKNLNEGKPGLAAARGLAGFDSQSDPARKVELHLSITAALAFLKAADLQQPRAAAYSLSSFALAAAPDGLRLDFRVPLPELITFFRAQGR